MTLCQTTGYLAACLVVMAYCMKDIGSLRAMAIASNVAFLVYGIGLGLVPVWSLHAVARRLDVL